MGDGMCVHQLPLLSCASRHAQKSCDFDNLFVWDTEDSLGSHLLRTEEKAK